MLNNQYILFSITEYLSDKDSLSLLTINKKFYKDRFQYKIKKCLEFREYIDSYSNYKILKIKNYIPGCCKLKYGIKSIIYDNKVIIDENIDILPDTIEHIKISRDFKIIDKYPKKIKFLDSSEYGNNCIIKNLPDTITHISLFKNIPSILPKSLEVLEILDTNEHYNQSLKNLYNLKKIILRGKKLIELPDSLLELEIDDGFNDKIKYFPPKLKVLKLGHSHKYDCNNYNHPLENLPETLEELYIYSCEFNHPLNKLPEKLKVLDIRSWEFNYPLDNLPKNLTTLVLIEKWNQSTKNFPDSLQHFKFGIYFEGDISHLRLKTLRYDFEHHYFEYNEIYSETQVFDDYDMNNDPNIKD